MEHGVERVDLNKVDWKSSREFFESLGEALDKLDDKDETYNFTWVGKRKSIIEAGAPIDKTLRPDVEASKDFDNTKNMLIVGDNLDALKLLQESYLGKIKMIYIDPPYNTGHDFVYHDNFTIKKTDYDDATKNEDGDVVISEDEFTENSKSNGRFHSDWLSMMYPRLKLARNLLSDDGVIFISIDDNEQANLKKVCDEVFGEDNFVAQLNWKGRGGRQDSKYYAAVHEYVFCYARDISNFIAGEEIKSGDVYPKFDEKKQRFYKTQLLRKWGSNSRREDRPNLFYSIKAPDGSDVYPMLKGVYSTQNSSNFGCWRHSASTMEQNLRDGKVEFIKQSDGSWVAYEKIFAPLEGEESTKKYTTWIEDTNDGASVIKMLFGSAFFDYPKSPSLLCKFFKMANVEMNDIVLDFFSGSGTTGHAVMDLNTEDGGNRQYICVQLDEKIDEKSEAHKAGYETIDQITVERLRRAGEKIKAEHPDANIDTGFRVFRIDFSNEKDNIRKPLNELKQAGLYDDVDNIKKDRTPLDLLFGIIYVSALPFDLKLEARKIGENTVYLYGYLDEGTGLVACFDDNLSEETIKEIANLKALTAAFKDSSFRDSSNKINHSEYFRIISPDTKVKVI